MTATLKIVICEPVELLREALAHLLISDCNCEIVDAIAPLENAISATNSNFADALVLDLTWLGSRDQSRLAACLRSNCLDARLLVLADAGQSRQLNQLLACGVDACMLTCEGAGTLRTAVAALATGSRYRSPGVAQALGRGARTLLRRAPDEVAAAI